MRWKDPDFDGDVDTLNTGKDCSCEKNSCEIADCSCVKAYSELPQKVQKDGYKRRILRPRLRATITVKPRSRLDLDEMKALRLSLIAKIRM